ncbi:MAG: hypothetical protein ISR59_08080 [Anaerolineales bacterium]|uniref:B3/B4 tRNA-binding domain-containing protein n=1 Tax=Candidatus Desulfolinea nitratireducens TaxID=2841698 RepID=A0A8J6NH72_9CHLR|nr:hypothetical protein [Candidatus Desulfolinea nitratireducens]MBL6961055.1 hypothetical protein [Anaerolineales bacterium]
MLLISGTDEWKKGHPGAIIGLLELSGVDNKSASLQLEERKRETEARLRDLYAGFTRQDLVSLPVLSTYKEYYKRFKKTYHVQLQVESILLKGKNLPSISPLVDANFIAEVETFVLTAGHDVAKLKGPTLIDVSHEGEQMPQMNGHLQSLRPGDMVMKDAERVSCTIIYGQDNRSPITPATSHVLYVAYAPAGVPAKAVESQLQKIKEIIQSFSPEAVAEQSQFIFA